MQIVIYSHVEIHKICTTILYFRSRGFWLNLTTWIWIMHIDTSNTVVESRSYMMFCITMAGVNRTAVEGKHWLFTDDPVLLIIFSSQVLFWPEESYFDQRNCYQSVILIVFYVRGQYSSPSQFNTPFFFFPNKFTNSQLKKLKNKEVMWNCCKFIQTLGCYEKSLKFKFYQVKMYFNDIIITSVNSSIIIWTGSILSKRLKFWHN